MPGDALIHLLGEEGYARLCAAGPVAVAAAKTEFGLNGNAAFRYGGYLLKYMTGEWGYSYYYGRPVAEVILQRLEWTLWLFFPAFLVSVLLGGLLGTASGWRSQSPGRQWQPALLLCLVSIPAYCLGLLLQSVDPAALVPELAGVMQVLPGLWWEKLPLLAPLTVLVVHGTAYKCMIMRNAVRQELDEPYVVTALSKGLSNRRILYGHILKNALPPYITVAALNLGFMMGGALLVEVVFSFQGMGTLIYQAVLARDYPVLSGALLVLSVSVLSANLAADIVSAMIDPRLRKEAADE